MPTLERYAVFAAIKEVHDREAAANHTSSSHARAFTLPARGE
jgi:hypothetical protein